MTSPRKLCDFKPAYGYIFENKISDYQYWGYCDIDVILGDLNKTIPLELEYDKYFVHGHMTLFKNIPKINRLFMSNIQYNENYCSILSDEKNRVFDESSDGLNINLISNQCGINLYYDYKIADINPYSFLFKRSLYDYSCPTKQGRKKETEKILKQIFYWRKGKLFRYALNETDEIVIDEFRYLHFQKRNLDITGATSCDSFIIVPNTVIPYKGEISKDFIKIHSNKKLIYPKYFYLKWKNVKKRIGGC